MAFHPSRHYLEATLVHDFDSSLFQRHFSHQHCLKQPFVRHFGAYNKFSLELLRNEHRQINAHFLYIDKSIVLTNDFLNWKSETFHLLSVEVLQKRLPSCTWQSSTFARLLVPFLQ